jgi:hypothetical protein
MEIRGTREMTLGEEIIGLAAKGIEVSTVERMYRKYIDISAASDAVNLTEKYCYSDIGIPMPLVGSPDAKVGDKFTIELSGLGEFTVTIHKITDYKIMIIFDDYVTKRPMNESDTNKGGFNESDLNRWLQTKFFAMLPCPVRVRLTSVSLPSVGEIFGWDNACTRGIFESDNDEQLPLMKQRQNRVAYLDNECDGGWLKNATKESVASAHFASVNYVGEMSFYDASYSFGVRPVLWLSK